MENNHEATFHYSFDICVYLIIYYGHIIYTFHDSKMYKRDNACILLRPFLTNYAVARVKRMFILDYP